MAEDTTRSYSRNTICSQVVLLQRINRRFLGWRYLGGTAMFMVTYIRKRKLLQSSAESNNSSDLFRGDNRNEMPSVPICAVIPKIRKWLDLVCGTIAKKGRERRGRTGPPKMCGEDRRLVGTVGCKMWLMRVRSKPFFWNWKLERPSLFRTPG